MSAAALEFQGIEKAFNRVPVLRGVSFSVGAGRTVGLVGENGAGKSTLMNILGGNLRADGGAMRLHGATYAPAHPTDATRARIAFIHQELNLFSNLTIAENLFLTGFPRAGALPWIDRRASRVERWHEGSSVLVRGSQYRPLAGLRCGVPARGSPCPRR